MTRYYTFDFPDGVKLLPKGRFRYEVVSGRLGLIATDDSAIQRKMEATSRSSDGRLREVSSEAVDDILKPLRLAEQFRDPPSFTQQTKWLAGIFDLPYAPGTCYFNCGIARLDRLYLFTRRYRYVPRNFGAHFGSNDLVIWPLSDELTPGEPIIPIPPRRYDGEQWEDPRAMVVDGRCYVGMATYVQGKHWKIRQALTLMSDDLSRFSVAAEPDYGGNSSVPETATEHEKNWLWLSADRCIYTLEPMQVFGLNGKLPSEVVPVKIWRFGRVRGGAPPVRVGDEFFLFFHSSRPWSDEYGRGRRRYYMGAATMTTEPPFRLTAITPDPLLIGSHHDPRELSSPLVIFPCGAIYQDGTWLVTMGINDERCGWIKIPHTELCQRLKPL